MEAFHYRYHRLALRIEEIVGSGELGKLQRVEAALCFPLPKFSDIRYDYSLGGGATMDAGCYAVHMVRTFGGATPEVVSAQANAQSADRPGHDRRATVSRRIYRPGPLLDVVVASAADQRPRGRRAWRATRAQPDNARGLPSTRGPYTRWQAGGTLCAPRVVRIPARRFRRRRPALQTSEDYAQDAFENMTVIDAIYRAAGLLIRVPG
jgi:predicted dehydrogenase